MYKILKNSKSSSYVVALGVILICIQSFTNRPLWLDEGYLSLNIIQKSFKSLLNPLEYNQVAPILFLIIEKAIASIFNNTEFGLRFFPFLCSILSLILFEKILYLLFSKRAIVLFCISIFTFNITFIDYANEVKQYMVDLLLLLLLLYFSFKENNNNAKYYIIILICFVCIFTSNISPIFVFTIFLYFIYKAYRDKNYLVLKLLLICSGCLFFTFALYYSLFIFNHPARTAMIEEWTYNRAFLPTNLSSSDLFNFIFQKTRQTFTNLISYGNIVGYLILILYITGIIQLLKNNNKGLLFILVLPIILHLFLSSLKLYPYEKRLILYQIPLLIIAAGFGLLFMINKLRLDIKNMSYITPVLFFSLFINYNKFPIVKTDIKSSLIFVKKNTIKDDCIYISYLSGIPFKYYSLSYPELFSENCNYKIGQKTLQWKDKWTFNNKIFEEDLKKLLINDRIWLLFSNIGDEAEKDVYANNFLLINGYKLTKKLEYKNSTSYLFQK
jgi:hypothetical protein